jgi:hypothetical protein
VTSKGFCVGSARGLFRDSHHFLSAQQRVGKRELAGLLSRIDYLERLGVGAIWLMVKGFSLSVS